MPTTSNFRDAYSLRPIRSPIGQMPFDFQARAFFPSPLYFHRYYGEPLSRTLITAKIGSLDKCSRVSFKYPTATLQSSALGSQAPASTVGKCFKGETACSGASRAIPKSRTYRPGNVFPRSQVPAKMAGFCRYIDDRFAPSCRSFAGYPVVTRSCHPRRERIARRVLSGSASSDQRTECLGCSRPMTTALTSCTTSTSDIPSARLMGICWGASNLYQTDDACFCRSRDRRALVAAA